MSSVDLQNGVFEEEGIRMLEKWETEGVSKILGKDKQALVKGDTMLLISPKEMEAEAMTHESLKNQYEDIFKK